MRESLRDQQTLDCMVRALWTLVERAGGTITISGQEVGPMTGAIKVTWDDGQITVSIGEGVTRVDQ